MTLNTVWRNNTQHQHMANALRFLAADAVEAAQSGHPGMPMGMADVATVLFQKHLKFSAANPDWPDRDRFILSAGHGSMLLYGLLHLCGYADVPLSAIKNFRQLGSPCAGHPEYGAAKGIETTTGPLGQGIANAVGMALAERILEARFNDLVNHNTYFIAGDGCLMEGICQEAISLAGHLRLGKLIGLFDDNDISIDGKISLTSSEDQLARFAAAGWHVQHIDGHDATAIDQAIEAAKADSRPSLIACKTIIGLGAPQRSGTSKAHGSPLGAEEITAARKALGWNHAAFDIPADIAKAWQEAGTRGDAAYQTWLSKYQENTQKDEFDRRIQRKLPVAMADAWKTLRKDIIAKQPAIASRAASQKVLDHLAPIMPELIGGSADLTGSNNTQAKSQQGIQADQFTGQYVYYGIREHAMAAMINGMTLHGGITAYGGTFLVFSDYCRPAVRLAALMGISSIFVFSHDSIGLGEDGPTHQPVEHLAALRAIPRLNVYRPADMLETLESWQAALEGDQPAALILSRQKLPATGRQDSENRTQQGAYVLSGDDNASLCLVASGSEVGLAMEAAAQLEIQGTRCKVVSVPCLDIFLNRPKNEQQQVLGQASRIIIEAAIQQPWDRLLRDQDVFIGMDSFGESAPANALFTHFGITTDAIIATAKQLIA